MSYVPPSMQRNKEAKKAPEEEGVYVKAPAGVETSSTFKGQLIDSKILANMERRGILAPTLVQKYVLPLALRENDLLICAPTGMGKTVSFLVPALNHVISLRKSGEKKHTSHPSVLVLTPTRELALQIEEECSLLSKGLNSSCVSVYGGPENKKQQESRLRGGVSILIGTPGRVLDFLHAEKVLSLSQIEILVLDEADTMLEMGFAPQLNEIVKYLSPKRNRQTMMFSATFPEAVQAVSKQYFQKPPVEITVGHGPLEDITQEVVQTDDETYGSILSRAPKLLSLLGEYGYRECSTPVPASPVPQRRSGTPRLVWKKRNEGEKKEDEEKKRKPKIVVFVEKKTHAAALVDYLRRKGIECTGLSGDKSQPEREQALQDFKNGIFPILVATSIAARGLDIPGVLLVVNYFMPRDLKDYVHRIGRTGRAGKKGRSVTFFSRSDQPLACELASILKNANQAVPSFLLEAASASGSRDRGKEHRRREERHSASPPVSSTAQQKKSTRPRQNKLPRRVVGEIDVEENISWDMEIS